MLGLNKRALLIGGALLYLALLAWAFQRVWDERNARTGAEIAQQPLNDSTSARLAATRIERDSLRVLLQAAKQLNGELIVALRLKVPRRDTVYKWDTLKTTVFVDGSRTASFGDSTTWAVVRGTVTAPPYPGALGITYTVSRPAFNPAVGIVRSGNAYFATVSWQNERAEVEVPFVDVPPKLPFVVPYVRGAYSPVGAMQAGAGMGFRVGRHLEPYVEVNTTATRRTINPAQLWLGSTYRF